MTVTFSSLLSAVILPSLLSAVILPSLLGVVILPSLLGVAWQSVCVCQVEQIPETSSGMTYKGSGMTYKGSGMIEKGVQQKKLPNFWELF